MLNCSKFQVVAPGQTGRRDLAPGSVMIKALAGNLILSSEPSYLRSAVLEHLVLLILVIAVYFFNHLSFLLIVTRV